MLDGDYLVRRAMGLIRLLGVCALKGFMETTLSFKNPGGFDRQLFLLPLPSFIIPEPSYRALPFPCISPLSPYQKQKPPPTNPLPRLKHHKIDQPPSAAPLRSAPHSSSPNRKPSQPDAAREDSSHELKTQPRIPNREPRAAERKRLLIQRTPSRIARSRSPLAPPLLPQKKKKRKTHRKTRKQSARHPTKRSPNPNMTRKVKKPRRKHQHV